MSTPGGRWLERTPLRISLVATILVLVATALLIAGIVVTASLRGYLYDRLDERLFEATDAAVERIRSTQPEPGFGSEDPYRLPTAYVVQINDASGTVVRVLSSPEGGAETTPTLPGLPVDEAEKRSGEPYTVTSDGEAWRVVTFPFVDRSGSLTVATSLSPVVETFTRMVVVQVVVGVVVLAALGVVGYLLVRRSLRPLRQVEATAAAITAGDLTERVPGTDPRTEVGSVATALNTMLAQVESSFSESERAKAEAVTAEVRMRRFLADASHELRTPLTSIRGWAELYRRGGTREPAAVERSMTRIEQEATRMGLLVEDMLLLARLDEHRPMARAPVDLLVLAADAVTDAAAVDPGRPVELGEPHDAVVVLGDEARLRQVVVNLVGNALVHTPEGTRVVVGVDARPQDGDPPATLQQWAVLEVADEGPGLSAEESERVFERFYRADPARSRSRGGTGLGLSIVAAVVAAHGGRVDVESTPGAGSRFRVWLPLAEDKGREVREP